MYVSEPFDMFVALIPNTIAFSKKVVSLEKQTKIRSLLDRKAINFKLTTTYAKICSFLK